MTDEIEDQGGNSMKMRLAVFETGAVSSATIVTLTHKPGGDTVLSVEEHDLRIEVIRAVAGIVAKEPTPQGLSPSEISTFKVDALITGLQGEGFQVDRLPEADVTMRFEFDLRSGTVIGQQEAMHSFISPNTDISRNMTSIVRGVVENIAAGVSKVIRAKLNEGDDVSAARLAVDPENSGRIILSQSADLLKAICDIERSRLDPQLRIDLLKLLVTLASNQSNHLVSGPAADEILEEDLSLDPEVKSSLKNIVAISAKTRGETEYALSLWRDLLKTPELIEAGERGWIWRNLSMALEYSDPEAARAARHSFDAFLEAGDKREASKSLAQLSYLQEENAPDQAMQQLAEMLELMSIHGIMNDEIRANIFHMRGRKYVEIRDGDSAYNDAIQAVEIRRGLLGVDEHLISSLHLAAIAADMKNDVMKAAEMRTEATEIEDRTASSHFLHGRRVTQLLKSFDVEEAQTLWAEAEAQGNNEILAGTGVAVTISDPKLTPIQRMGKLEGLLRNLERRGSRNGPKQPVYLAIGTILSELGEAKRAVAWFRRAYDESPLDANNRDLLINSLWKAECWNEAAIFLKQQIERSGELPGLLFAFGKSLFEAGDLSGAVTALHKASNSEDTDVDRQKAILRLRNRALDLGGTIIPEKAKEYALPAVSLNDIETALSEFANFITSVKRMTFWSKPKGSNKYKWRSHPESFGQTLLHTFIQAKFGTRAEIYEELDTGAGRLDILMRFQGGLSVVVELKMCGSGYPSTYAASGEGQIRHYMDNRNVNVGILLTFDARTRDAGKCLMEGVDSGKYTIKEILVDVRPGPPSKKTSSDPA